MRAYSVEQKNHYLGNAIFLAEGCYCGYPPLCRMRRTPVEKKMCGHINNYFIVKHTYKRTKLRSHSHYLYDIHTSICLNLKLNKLIAFFLNIFLYCNTQDCLNLVMQWRAKLQVPLEFRTVMSMPSRHTGCMTRKAIVLSWSWGVSGVFLQKSAVRHSSISSSVPQLLFQSVIPDATGQQITDQVRQLHLMCEGHM